MPNTLVPANATPLPACRRYDRSAIMRAAVAYARQIIAQERQAYLNRWTAQIRHGGKRPPMVLPTWRRAMSQGLKLAWWEARRVEPVPEVAAELERLELSILTIQCAERMTRPEEAMLAALCARQAELRSMSPRLRDAC